MTMIDERIKNQSLSGFLSKETRFNKGEMAMITTKYNLFKQFKGGNLDENSIKISHDEKYSRKLKEESYYNMEGTPVYLNIEDFFIAQTPFTKMLLFNSDYATEIDFLIPETIDIYEEAHTDFDFDKGLWMLLPFSSFFVIKNIDDPKIEIFQKLSKVYTNDGNEYDIPIDYYSNIDQEVWYA